MFDAQENREEQHITWFRTINRIIFFELINVLLVPYFFPESAREYLSMLTTGSTMWNGERLVWVHGIPSASLEHQANFDFIVYIILSQLIVFLLTIFTGSRGIQFFIKSVQFFLNVFKKERGKCDS